MGFAIIALAIFSLILAGCSDTSDGALRECQRQFDSTLILSRCEGDYYLIFAYDTIDSDGPFDGAILHLGHSPGFVWAERRATFASEPDGWMILDLERNMLMGPFGATELTGRLRDDCGCEPTAAPAPQQVWDGLPEVESARTNKFLFDVSLQTRNRRF